MTPQDASLQQGVPQFLHLAQGSGVELRDSLLSSRIWRGGERALPYPHLGNQLEHEWGEQL